MRVNNSEIVSWPLGLCVLILFGPYGCRDPEFEETPWRIDDFDPGTPGAGPAPLCPPGSEAPINNAYSPYMGGDEYPDLVVEVFSYFRCQNCAELALLLDEIWERREDFKDHVRIYFHHFPLYEHETAMELHASTIAAQEQGFENFWAMHDFVFEGIRSDPQVLYTPEDLYEYAKNSLQLDMAEYERVVNDDEKKSYILWDKSQAVELGLIGTPGLFICGKSVMSWPEIEATVDHYLQEMN